MKSISRKWSYKKKRLNACKNSNRNEEWNKALILIDFFVKTPKLFCHYKIFFLKKKSFTAWPLYASKSINDKRLNARKYWNIQIQIFWYSTSLTINFFAFPIYSVITKFSFWKKIDISLHRLNAWVFELLV